MARRQRQRREPRPLFDRPPFPERLGQPEPERGTGHGGATGQNVETPSPPKKKGRRR